MESIDEEINNLQAQIDQLKRKKVTLVKNKAEELRYQYPVVYTIHENASGRSNHIVNYMDFSRNHGYYTTRAKAEAMWPYFQNMRLSHHSSTFKVKAEASENISDEDMLNLDVDTYYPSSP